MITYLVLKLMDISLFFLSIYDTIDPDAEFSVCVQFSQYTAKLVDGNFVHVPRRYEEWVVDYRQCTLESLEKDFEANVNWGKCQQVVVCVDMTRALVRKIRFTDSMDLVHAFFVGKSERRLILFVDVVDYLFCFNH